MATVFRYQSALVLNFVCLPVLPVHYLVLANMTHFICDRVKTVFSLSTSASSILGISVYIRVPQVVSKYVLRLSNAITHTLK